MPLPKTSDVGTLMHELKHKGKKRPYKQRLAIALSTARKYAKGSRKAALERSYRKYKARGGE